jgi:hypothetical protein
MHRLRFALAATLVSTTLGAAVALAQAPTTSVLAGKKFTPPLKGEAMIEFTAPVTKREKEMVVTRIQVKNVSSGPIARLAIAETWYDKGGAIVAGGKGTINGLLQPNEIQMVTIETPYSAKMNGNQYLFSHVNGTVKPHKVTKLDGSGTDAKAPAAKKAAPAKKK